jgi:hypothetical protein
MLAGTSRIRHSFRRGLQPRKGALAIGALALALVMALGALTTGYIPSLKWNNQLNASTDVSGLALDGASSAYCGTNSCESVTAALTTSHSDDVIFAFCVINNSTIPGKIVDAAGHTWTLRAGGVATTVYEWYTTASTKLKSDGISCSTPAFLNHNLIVFAVSGANLNAPFGLSIPEFKFSSAGGTPSAKVLLSNSPDFLVSLLSVGGLGCPYPVVGSGFTQILAGGSPPCDEVDYEKTPATGSHTVHYSSTGSHPYRLIVDAVESSSSSAPASWTNITVIAGPSPTPRWFPSITYDAHDGYDLLFGGATAGGNQNDTWKFEGGRWTNITPTISPPPGGRITYDARAGYVLLFGSGSTAQETWKFSDGKWTQLFPSISPPGRWGESIAYDANDGYVVMFGGQNGSMLLSDTWVFQKGNWMELHPTVQPVERRNAGLTYDAKNGYLLMFGGLGPTGADLGDTWTLVGGEWAQLSPSVAPAPRVPVSMTYDPLVGHVILFGGRSDAMGTMFDDTWEYVGGNWKELHPSNSPSGRQAAGVAFDPARGYILLFGGSDLFTSATVGGYLGETWTYGTSG